MNGEGVMPIGSAPSCNGIRRNATLGGLALALLAAFIFSLALGSVHIPVREIVTILTGGESAKASWSHIVLTFRLPKALTAVLAGAALAVSGLQMQTLFRNPLADPFILGISAFIYNFIRHGKPVAELQGGGEGSAVEAA